MKSILPISALSIIFLLSSCSGLKRYQVSNLLSSEGEETLFFENDELSLELNFWNYGGALDLLIYNKTDSLLYMDWSNSNYIINNIAYECTSESPIIISEGYYNEDMVLSRSYTSDHAFSVRKKNTFFSQIPPKSIISEHFVGLTVPEMEMEEEVQQLFFNESNSPLHIRLYLAYTKNKELSNLKYIDKSYYVNSITELNESALKYNKRTNRFYIIKTGDDKKNITMKALGVGAVLYLVIMLFAFS